jgi:hypothetical protein
MKPIASFYRLAVSAPSIRPADPTLSGSLPLRAVQHCDPVTAASGYGWHVMAPTDFGLLFEGRNFLMTFDQGATWHPLTECQIPSLQTEHERCQRHEMGQILPPFAAALPERGIVQIWSGYFATTRKGWALSIGGVANRFNSDAYDCMEGIVETDWWTGPLFTNLVFRQTNRPVLFSRGDPLFQVRPVFKPAYAKAVKESAEIVLNPADIKPDVFSRYKTAVTRDGTLSEHKGWYAKKARQGRR